MTRASRKVETNEIRESIDCNSYSIIGFSQPQPFIEAYKPLPELREEGLLICTIMPLLFQEELD